MKKAEDFRNAFGPVEKGFENAAHDTMDKLLRQERDPSYHKALRFRTPAVALALMAIICVGVMALSGHLGVMSNPDDNHLQSAYTLQPMVTALNGGAQEPGGPEDETPATASDLEGEILSAKEQGLGHRLWAFFVSWAEQDWTRMMNLSAVEWARNTENPKEQLIDFMGERYPQKFVVESVSGTYGDPVRTASCIVQVMEGLGNEPEYERLEYKLCLEPDGMYGICPIVDPGTVDTLPAEGDFCSLTEEGLISSELAGYDEGLKDRLKPLDLRYEKDGLRFEMISGEITRNHAYFLCSLQDLAGKYKDLSLEPSFRSSADSAYGYAPPVYHDALQHKTTYLYIQKFNAPAENSNRLIDFMIEDITVKQKDSIDLIPLLKQYGKTVEGIAPPKELLDDRMEYTVSPEGTKFLDYNNPLNIPVVDDVFLTGIGWIGDQLHVQFHTTRPGGYATGNGVTTAWTAWIRSNFSDEVEYYWSEDRDAWPEWQEYILNCRPEQVDSLTLEADVSILKDLLKGGWELHFPLESFWTETSDEESSAADSDTFFPIEDSDAEWYIKYQLNEFFSRWAQNDPDEMLYSVSSEWKFSTEDPRAALAKLTASGTPVSYQINRLSGVEGDPVRTAVCTLLMDPGNGGTPEYAQFEILMRRASYGYYAIDPSSLDSRKAAESDPAVETVSLTEEDIIRRELDSFTTDDPQVFDKLIKVDRSFETREGIRMNILSALVDGADAWFLYTVEDPQGKYADYLPDLCFENTILDANGTYSSYQEGMLYRNAAEHRTLHLYHVRYPSLIKPEDRTVTLSFGSIGFRHTDRFDLLPLLKQYGTETAGIAAPENAEIPYAEGTGPRDTSDMKVLDYTSPLDIPLTGDVRLTGIGWIDGQLHVQFFRPAQQASSPGENGFWTSQIDGCKPADASYDYSVYPVHWTTTEGVNPGDWEEHILDCNPEYIDSLSLDAQIDLYTYAPYSNYDFVFPLLSIMKEQAEAVSGQTAPETASADTVASAEEDRALEYCSLNLGNIDQDFPNETVQMKPVNLSCEKNGIRLKVHSGLVKGNESWLVCSVQDVEEQYLDANLNSFLSDTVSTRLVETCSCYLLDGATRGKEVYMLYTKSKEPVITEDRDVSVILDLLAVQHCAESANMASLVNLYGKEEAKGIKAPKLPLDYPLDAAVKPQDLKILDPAQALDIPLFGDPALFADYSPYGDISRFSDIRLTGIGWLDGQLHLQFRRPKGREIPYRNGTHDYDSLDFSLSYIEDQPDTSVLACQPLQWTENGNSDEIWMEYIFNGTPADIERQEICMTVALTDAVLDDGWTVEFPLSTILADAKEETPAAADLPADDSVRVDYIYSHSHFDKDHPGIWEQLKPVNLTYEEGEVRFDVLSGLVKDNKFWFVCAVNYPKDQYNADDWRADFSSTICIGDQEASSTIYTLDKTPQRDLYAVCQRSENPFSTNSRNISVILDALYAQCYASSPKLTSLMTLYGKDAEGVKPPELLPGSKVTLEDLKILDPAQAVDAPLFGNADQFPDDYMLRNNNEELFKDVRLAGIGWLDGRLHLQIRRPKEQQLPAPNGPVESLEISYVYSNVYPGKAVLACAPLLWADSEDSNTIWEEYIFNVSAEELEQISPSMKATITNAILDDGWIVEFPLSTVLADAENASEAELEALRAENERLVQAALEADE